jgi:hypothetical protein
MEFSLSFYSKMLFDKFCLILKVIVSSKIPTKNYRDFCPASLLESMAEISVIFGWSFGRNDDLINSF